MKINEIRMKLANLNGINLKEDTSFERLKSIIEKDIRLPVITWDKLPVGTLIYRSREHKEYELNKCFPHLDDLYARKDVDNIKNYGRANIPHQSIFYAGDCMKTSIAEASLIGRSVNYKSVEYTEITTSCFELVFDINLALVVNSDNASDKTQIINRHNIKVNEIIRTRYPEKSFEILEILKRFSNSFSKDTKGKNILYKSSCAYAQYSYQVSDGILYPSVQRKYEGINLALLPDIARTKFKLVSARRDKFVKEKNMKFEHTLTQPLKKISSSGNLMWGKEILI